MPGTASRKRPPAELEPWDPNKPVWVFTVRTGPDTAWRVIEWRTGTFPGEKATERVAFTGMDEWQAHCVAQALYHYHTKNRPLAPMQDRYTVTYATLRCAGALTGAAR